MLDSRSSYFFHFLTFPRSLSNWRRVIFQVHPLFFDSNQHCTVLAKLKKSTTSELKTQHRTPTITISTSSVQNKNQEDNDANLPVRELVFDSDDAGWDEPFSVNNIVDNDSHPFTFQTPNKEKINQIRLKNSYIERQFNEADLVINNPAAVAKVYKEDGPLGLIFLFINPKFIDKFMLNLTQEVLNMKEALRGTPIRLTVAKTRCVIGLNIAMSLCNTTTMKELWSMKMFLGSVSICECMSGGKFLTIQGSLRIHSKSSPKNHNDPLWSCGPLFLQVFHNFATVACPVGVPSLDKATCPSKSQNSAQTYLPNKPDMFGFRFYLLNGWRYVYTYVIWDKGSGNTRPTSSSDRFLTMFGELLLAFNNFVTSFKSKIRKACLIDPKSASMMWVLMFGLLYQQIHSRRPVVSNHRVRQAEQQSGSKDVSDNDNGDEENENDDEDIEKIPKDYK